MLTVRRRCETGVEVVRRGRYKEQTGVIDPKQDWCELGKFIVVEVFDPNIQN